MKPTISHGQSFETYSNLWYGPNVSVIKDLFIIRHRKLTNDIATVLRGHSYIIFRHFLLPSVYPLEYGGPSEIEILKSIDIGDSEIPESNTVRTESFEYSASILNLAQLCQYSTLCRHCLLFEMKSPNKYEHGDHVKTLGMFSIIMEPALNKLLTLLISGSEPITGQKVICGYLVGFNDYKFVRLDRVETDSVKSSEYEYEPPVDDELYEASRRKNLGNQINIIFELTPKHVFEFVDEDMVRPVHINT